MLHSLFSKIWEKEEVPAQWKEGIVIKLPKKGDLRDCSNYRGIMLLSVPGKVLNRILLERMREAVDPMLRDQQAGFRRNRSCADQIASLRIIVEQSLEWNSPLYINFIDYEKAFDSVDREALWKLLRHYGVPGKIISLIQCTYQDMSCRIAHAGQLSESFEVKTGVRQGCLLSPFLFLLVIDWIMKTTTAGRKNGIQWTLWTQLDDLDFADDLALLSHSHSQMQDKTTRLEATSAGTGLKINRKKTELMKINTTANTPVTVGGEPIREVESFVYLGSVVDGQGGTDRDVTARIGKARAAMVMLKNIWASKVVSIRTKLRIFNSNVKSVLLYGCDTWRTTKTMQQKIQTFLNTCLRRIFNIRWPEKIRNEELWERAGQEPVAKQILRRKWGWIGHTLRKPASSTTRQALTWNPQGKRKRGRPRNSWRRDTEAELCKQGTNWTGVARLWQNRGYTRDDEYIATQGPLHSTMNDFWRMVWEHRVPIIVMLTQIQERGQIKCEKYWPSEHGEVRQYGEVKVTTTSVSSLNDYITTIFSLRHEKEDEEHEVIHFHYLKWLDMTADVQLQTILDFVSFVRQHVRPDRSGPMVVHCSAGAGRTGTFISIDYVMQFINERPVTDQLDIYGLILRMRTYRCRMVQTDVCRT
nr:hypothetical protein BaRGS_012212 [Batillaria attramentaria]